MMIKDFGPQVASVWAGLRPHTRQLVESFLQSAAGSATRPLYDLRAERELSGLLKALDAQATETAGKAVLNAEQARELRRMADACEAVLRAQSQSAEAFALLLERALRARDFAEVDALADAISARLAPSEICELTRHHSDAIRALALEALTLSSTSTLVKLLSDQLDALPARSALERQAREYGSDEARWIVRALDNADQESEHGEEF